MPQTRSPISSSRRRRFIAAALLLFAAVPLAALVAIDLALHAKYETRLGYNRWGYRGPVVSAKRGDECRVVILGGSTAFGYGADWEDTIGVHLEQRLNQRNAGRYTVVNLGYNNEGAYSMAFTLADYAYLGYDLAILYEGYNDLMGDEKHPNRSVFRHQSPVFRFTGYLPIFPIIFREKAAAMLHGGDTTAAYWPDGDLVFRRTGKTVFRPDLATRTGAAALEGAADIESALERQLSRALAERPVSNARTDPTGCQEPWGDYCHSIAVAVDRALAFHARVIVATQPYEAGPTLRARHAEQQRELAGLIARRYASNSGVRYVNFGDAVDLGDPTFSFDRMHLTGRGNDTIAQGLVEPVAALAHQPRAGARR